MESQQPEPASFVRHDAQGTLSMPVLVGLLQTVVRDEGKPFWFEATGSSMWPFMREGDALTVAPVAASGSRLGDAVAFLSPATGKLVVHRVVGWRDDDFLIRGDNTSESVDVVPATSILGQVTRLERGGRRVHFGLGPERKLIAFLSRWGLLQPLLSSTWRLVRPLVRR